jgi:hypothetical protein
LAAAYLADRSTASQAGRQAGGQHGIMYGWHLSPRIAVYIILELLDALNKQT